MCFFFLSKDFFFSGIGSDTSFLTEVLSDILHCWKLLIPTGFWKWSPRGCGVKKNRGEGRRLFCIEINVKMQFTKLSCLLGMERISHRPGLSALGAGRLGSHRASLSDLGGWGKEKLCPLGKLAKKNPQTNQICSFNELKMPSKTNRQLQWWKAGSLERLSRETIAFRKPRNSSAMLSMWFPKFHGHAVTLVQIGGLA